MNITYAYDALGRVTGRSINGTANASSWSYDAMNRVTGIVNSLGTFTPTYVDDFNTLGAGNDKGTTRLASMTYPNGQVTNYSYFSTTYDERLQEINNLNASSSVISKFDYTYDAKGQILSWKQQADSSAATRYDTGYDPAGQLLAAVKKTDSTNAVLHQYYYNYDAAGNRVSEQVDSGVTKTSVNTLNQITSQSAGGATLFQGIISQPGTVTVNGQPAAMTPTATNFVANPVLSSGTNTVTVVATNGNGAAQTNQYQVVVPSETGVSPSYDADGNMTNNGNGQTYAWDAENRLYEITQGSNTYKFTYDGLGRRVSETDNGTLVKQWIWAGTTMAEERNASGTVTKRFYPQGEQISGTAYFYTRGHLGSIREMMAANGTTIAARYDYDPYGRATLLSGSSSSDFQYAGYYEHAASGLNLTFFRAYDPNTARWLSRDPIGERGGINLYDFVQNSPVDLVDPMGLNPGDIMPSGGGGQFSWAGELGLGPAMTGLTGSVGAGGFWNGQIENNGGYLSGGLTGYGKTAPCNGQTPWGIAAYLGIGGGFFFTNAGSILDLSGPFSTYNLNTPVGSIQVGVSTNSAGLTTYIVSVSVGPGAGGGVSAYPTNTVTTNATTLSPQP